MKNNFLERNGFNSEGKTWIVIGEDTYSIKEFLKENGCRYDPILKWHTSELFLLPPDFKFLEIDFDSVFFIEEEELFVKETASKEIERKIKEAIGPTISVFYGKPKERFYDLTAVFKGARGFMGAYGWTNIYNFQHEDAVFVWFTQKELKLKKGTVVNLTATVKKHEEFRGINTTQITRAIITEVK